MELAALGQLLMCKLTAVEGLASEGCALYVYVFVAHVFARYDQIVTVTKMENGLFDTGAVEIVVFCGCKGEKSAEQEDIQR